MRPSLHLKINQQLTITPQLQQAIQLLQLSSLELEQEIKTILDANPLLETIETADNSDNNDEIFTNEMLNEIKIEFEGPTASYRDWDDNQRQNVHLQKSPEATLQQHLLWQAELTSFSEHEKVIATTLIDAISEEGYLINSLKEIQECLGSEFTIKEIETVLLQIQQFDPLGIGARNLAECLNIQLRALPPSTPWLEQAALLASEQKHLEALGRRDYTYLKTLLNLDERILNSVIKILKSLDPKPGTQISCRRCEYITPDILIRKKNGQWIVQLNRGFIPCLRVNPNYAALIHHNDTKGEVEMLREQLKEAKWFIKSLKNRQDTLLKVSKCIMERQKDFLERGEEAMKPLSLQDVAKTVELHESTVSRITSQKYILTPRGIFELKFFFSNPLKRHESGENQSATAIRALIKRYISNESTNKPLSDQRITRILSEQGINIARRTVAKYREAMRIPTSNERKNIGLS